MPDSVPVDTTGDGISNVFIAVDLGPDGHPLPCSVKAIGPDQLALNLPSKEGVTVDVLVDALCTWGHQAVFTGAAMTNSGVSTASFAVSTVSLHGVTVVAPPSNRDGTPSPWSYPGDVAAALAASDNRFHVSAKVSVLQQAEPTACCTIL